MTSSLFVGNLHSGIDQASLRNYFIRAGNVRDVYMPRNQKSLQRRYGFVRFNSQEEAKEVWKRCNGDFVWGRDIIVRPAIRERRDALAHKITPTHFVPQKQRHFISRTEGKISNQLPFKKGSEEYLTYKPKVIDLQWLKGCSVGYLTKEKGTEDLQLHLRNRGIHCTVLHMGGRMVMLSFLSEELMRDAINAEQEWLIDQFEFIKPWDPTDLPKHRYVWIKCEQVPVHAWNRDFFKMIGDLYGSFIAIDSKTELKQRLDFGSCLIYTPVTDFIHRKHKVCIQDMVFEIQVTEDQCRLFDPKNDAALFLRQIIPTPSLAGESHRIQIGEDRREVGTPVQIQIQSSNSSPGEPHFRGEEVAAGTNVQITHISNSNSPPAAKDPTPGKPSYKEALSSIGQLKPTSVISKSPSTSLGSTQLVPESPISISSPRPTSHNPVLIQAAANPLFLPNSLHCCPSNIRVEPSPLTPIPTDLPVPSSHAINSKGLPGSHFPQPLLPFSPSLVPAPHHPSPTNSKTFSASSAHEGEDDISLEEDLAVGMESFLWQGRRLKRARDRRFFGISYGVGSLRKKKSSVGNKGPVPIPSSSAKSVKIHKTATSAWKLGQLIGLTHPGGDIGAVNLLKDMECRNWDEFEKQQNE